MTPKIANQGKWLPAAFLLSHFSFLISSCDSYLDELPDDRMEVTTIDNVQKLLTTAYPTYEPLMVAEYMSDNVDDYGRNNPNTTRFMDQLYHWADVTESNNSSPENFWQGCYQCIATANQALASLEALAPAMGAASPASSPATVGGGSAASAPASSARAEALLCRAYAHFMLANIFCQAYSPATASATSGIAYVDQVAEQLTYNPDRGTLADTYRRIDQDLQEALPFIGGDYSVPKYHFTPRAAYAFACRFYLYAEQWDKAIDYANRCLGSEPHTMLRDWAYTATMTQTYAAISQHYIDASLNCNLLLLTAYSPIGLAFGPYNYLSKYSHGQYLAKNETSEAPNIWGTATYYQGTHTYSATNLDKTVFFKLPYLFEYADPVAGTGYYRTVYPAFTTDETLLNRAEALVLTGRYDEAARDLTLWMQNIVQTDLVLTPAIITEFYNSVDYAYSDSLHIASTIKKHLHPKFDIGPEGDTREAMLQCVLGFRRIETLQAGMRWYDIKRYGIEIVRRTINAAGEPEKLDDILRTDDPRRAVQIPQRVRTAGVVPNPRLNIETED